MSFDCSGWCCLEDFSQGGDPFPVFAMRMLFICSLSLYPALTNIPATHSHSLFQLVCLCHPLFLSTFTELKSWTSQPWDTGACAPQQTVFETTSVSWGIILALGALWYFAARLMWSHPPPLPTPPPPPPSVCGSKPNIVAPTATTPLAASQLPLQYGGDAACRPQTFAFALRLNIFIWKL